jgi:hypothetical protein
MPKEKSEGKSTAYSEDTVSRVLTLRQCDGGRPSCARCGERSIVCEYDVESDTSRYATMQLENEVLLIERDLLRRLIIYMSTRSTVEAQEAFCRLRTGHDPLKVAQSLST